MQSNSCRIITYLSDVQSNLTEWLVFRQTCLDELLRHDGLGDFIGRTGCASCSEAAASYKCLDCLSGSLLRCKHCLVTSHQDNPLHRIEVNAISHSCPVSQIHYSPQCWNGNFFVATSLKDLGLRVQLGHGGQPCVSPSEGPKKFSVLDTSGIHYVAIDFCDCRTNGLVPRRVQLLRAGWFPATFNRPQTVFTFRMLDAYHELTLQAKTALYDYYHTILHYSDNHELGVPVVCN